IKISSRVQDVSESVTLKLNALAVQMAEAGKQIYNLTAGQLPFRPPTDFVEHMRDELNFLKSFQYSPVSGFVELRKKIIGHIEEVRSIAFSSLDVPFDCVVSNGAKHSLSNVLGALIDPGDEVILL